MPKKVLILGGGGGGAILANLLPKEDFKITVIDREKYHIFQPGHLWIAFKGFPKEKFKRPIRELLKPHVEFIQDEVVSVDLENRKVKSKGNRELDYDYIVIATGAELDFDAIPGNRELVEKFGGFYSTQENAEKMWKSILGMKEGNFVIAVSDPIYKCPPGPHKGAFLANEFFTKRGLKDKVKVILALPFPHEYPSKTIAEIIKPELEEKGIEVHTFFTVDSIDVEKNKIVSLEGEEIEYTVATVIPPHMGPQYEIKPSDVKDENSYVKIDKYTCRIMNFDDAYAIGDCTNAPTSKSGVTAHLQAEVVALKLQGYEAKFKGRTNCPLITNSKGLFIISDYDNPPVPVRLTPVKRLLEELFVATYWEAIRYPELWQPIFHAYFKATDPKILKKYRW
ncbi:MAG TPA: NAD(P)/FAD-dependent oxidoreductase [Thermoproteales archaeon]|nr:NAD(P)/FAD-dependent oxidoreductase [Thermoproteales archaeon]